MVEVQFTYSWEPPRYIVGQRVRFVFREGVHRDGTVAFIETRYNADGKARHCYTVRGDGHGRFSHLGDADVLFTI